jgi:hypothetical protein
LGDPLDSRARDGIRNKISKFKIPACDRPRTLLAQGRQANVKFKILILRCNAGQARLRQTRDK